jgi:hypothetical protein
VSVFAAFPGALLRRATQWLVEGETRIAHMKCEIRPLTVAGAAQVGSVEVPRRFLLPVELRHANHTASTNACDFRRITVTKPYNGRV